MGKAHINPQRQCGVSYNDGTFCGKEKAPGSQRCVSHTNTSPAKKDKPKLSLYAQRLKSTYDADDQLLWDAMPKGVDLTHELSVARLRVVKFRQMLADGEEWVMTDGKSTSQSGHSEAAISVHSLLEDALDTVRRLAATMNEIAPGTGLGGNLRISFEVIGEKGASIDGEVVPSLTDNEPPRKKLIAPDATAPEEDASNDRGYE